MRGGRGRLLGDEGRTGEKGGRFSLVRDKKILGLDFGVHPLCLVKLRRGNVTSTVPESYSYLFRHIVQVLSQILYTHQDR